MNKLRVTLIVLAAMIAAVLVAIIFLSTTGIATYGYVVGEDRRIYMVNLNSGELEWISRELEEIGRPSSIEINARESILYIASERDSWQWEYVPLIAVKLNESAESVFQSYVDPAPPKLNSLGFRDVSPVYSLRLSHDEEWLYTKYVNPEFAATTIVDSLTGKYVGQFDAPIAAQAEISPDGTMVADIWPSGIRIRESGVDEYPGVVWVRDLETREELSRVELHNNQGLYPPWGSKDHHFIDVNFQPRQGIYQLEIYDRESGELIAMYDDFDEAVKASPNQNHVTRIPGKDYIAMTAGSEVLVFNGLTAELVKKVHVVDEVRLTEIVVSSKPLTIDRH